MSKQPDPDKEPQKKATFQGRFAMSEERLKAVAERGRELLEEMSEEDLGKFTEHKPEKGTEE